MSQRPRIKDIAEQAGVSSGTVDRVLHERGNVAPDVRERILQVMEEMGYEPNLMARSLANNRKVLRIAVILPDFTGDPYWAQPKEGIERAAEAVRHYGVGRRFSFFSPVRPRSIPGNGKKCTENPARRNTVRTPVPPRIRIPDRGNFAARHPQSND
ncbi:MAG: LacI family DNA-binding transcriptional regulator [Lewinellaceae bacterium]|nr:LacI family DNA-binding transcriptional regulator [Lewinellaceae bacterium]